MAHNRSTTRVICVGVLLISFVACGLIFESFNRPSASKEIGLAKAAVLEARYQDAVGHADAALAIEPDNVQMILLAAECTEQLGDTDYAIKFLNRLRPQFTDPAIAHGWRQKADLELKSGRASDAKSTLEAVVSALDDDVAATRKLARLLSGCGSNFEALPLIRSLVGRGEANEHEVYTLARNGRALFGKLELQRLHQMNPSDPMPVHGLLMWAWQHRNLAGVRSLLFDSMDPAILRHALRASLAENDDSNVDDSSPQVEILKQRLSTDEHPATWRILAELELTNARPENARKLLVDAVEADPWNAESIYRLAELVKSDQPQNAEQLLGLWGILERIDAAAIRLIKRQPRTDDLQRITADLQSLGRHHEARAFARLALKNGNRDSWATEVIRRSVSEVNAVEFVHPVSLIRTVEAAKTVADEVPQPSAPNLQFDDVAEQVGLVFAYDNGRNPGQEGLKMHQWTGGGVAVLDVDADTWPDLFFTQGGDLLKQGSNPSDALFRNLRGERFTQLGFAIPTEGAFGQGVTCGDINNDGFDDLYVANVGKNQLLINQGDGTFVSLEVANDSQWTTSVAIADLTADGLPDLYDVNYLAGTNVFTQTCDHEGVQRICGPTDFPAEQDRIHISGGDGEFRKLIVPDPEANARGMGLVVGSLHNAANNSVYIANDESANQLLRVGSDGIVRDENALACGLALNSHGEAQGSMGIAIGDFDRNDRLDMFVTNYYSESNNLYSQIDAAIFVDRVTTSRLASSGFAKLGFGCQFLDADSDGFDELVVANGHLDDFTHKGHPFKMQPQLFYNLQNGSFAQPKVEGSYFDRDLLGRAVAVLDWNGDQRVDFVVTHIDDPVSVVTNSTLQQNSVVTLRLVGTESARVPIGATVTGSSGSKGRAWLTAGDGYQASNERLLRLLAKAASNDTQQPIVQISWPAQPEARNATVTAARKNVVIEGRSATYVIPN